MCIANQTQEMLNESNCCFSGSAAPMLLTHTEFGRDDLVSTDRHR